MRIKMKGITVTALTVLCIILSRPVIAEELVIVATNDTFQEAQGWVDFLEAKEIAVKHITPKEYSGGHEAKYFVIMGGMDEEDGIQVIVKDLLASEEFQWVSRKDNGKMYTKYILPENTGSSNSWGEGQNFIIFAGSSRIMAAEARENSRQNWWEELSIWFDIDESPTIHAY